MNTRRLDTTHQRAAMQRMHALLLTLLLLVPLGPAAATVYCVGSVSELQTATDNIENHGAVHDHDLRIRSGWYLLTPVAQQTHAVTINYKFSQYVNIRISGGWNAGCTQQAQSVTAATISVLDGQGLTGTLAVNRESWGVAGDPNAPAGKLQIDQLRIINSAKSGLLMTEINPGSYNHAVDVTLDRLQVDMSEDFGGINMWTTGAFVLRNSALIGNRGYRAALDVTSEQAIHVYNNTLRYNQITSGLGGNAQVGLNTLGVIYFYNNLIADGGYANLTTDLYIVDGNAFVRNNRFVGNVVQATPDLLIQSGNTTALPQFISSLNWRLASDSPLRDLGYTPGADPGLGARDYDGAVRVQGTAADLGAFELPPLIVLGPTLIYNPAAGASLGNGDQVIFTGVTTPGSSGNGSIAVTPTGGSNGGTTTLSGFTVLGADAAAFARTSAATLTFAAGVNTAQSVTLSCTSSSSTRFANLRATETIGGGATYTRYWRLVCPAGVADSVFANGFEGG